MFVGGNLRTVFLLIFVFASFGCSNSFFERPSSYPPGTTTGDFPEYDHFSSTTPSVRKPPTELLKEAVSLFEDIFLAREVGDYKCIDPNTFQKFIEMFFRTEQGTSPTLDYLCLFKAKNQHHDLRWVLSETRSSVWRLLPPTGLVDVDMKALKSIDVDEESSVSIIVEDNRSMLLLEGMKFNLSKYAVEGTPLAWVPESFLAFNVDKIEVTDEGKYLVKLVLPLGFPLSIKGEFETQVSKGKVKISF